MKKDLAEVKAYAEAMVDSNRARDAYVNKEQDKFFRRVNRQRADIDTLKERMEQSELRAGALELENESLSAHLDSMVDKLCFCTWVEVRQDAWDLEDAGRDDLRLALLAYLREYWCSRCSRSREQTVEGVYEHALSGLEMEGVDRSTIPRGTCPLQNLNAIKVDLLPWLLQGKYLCFVKGVDLCLYNLGFFLGVKIIIRG